MWLLARYLILICGHNFHRYRINMASLILRVRLCLRSGAYRATHCEVERNKHLIVGITKRLLSCFRPYEYVPDKKNRSRKQ